MFYRVNIHNDTNDRECYLIDHFLVSRYLLPGVDKVIDTLNDNLWIICAGYTDGDAQLGYTGSLEKGEIARDALVREGLEELGLDCSQGIINESNVTDKYRGKTIVSYTGIIDCDHVVPVTTPYEQPTIPMSCDAGIDVVRKITGIIVGSQQQLIDLAMVDTFRPESIDKDNINHVMILNIKEVKRIVNILRKPTQDKKPILWTQLYG